MNWRCKHLSRSAEDTAAADDFRAMFEAVYLALNMPASAALFSRSRGNTRSLFVSTGGVIQVAAIVASPGWEECEPPAREGTMLLVGQQDFLRRLR